MRCWELDDLIYIYIYIFHFLNPNKIIYTYTYMFKYIEAVYIHLDGVVMVKGRKCSYSERGKEDGRKAW